MSDFEGDSDIFYDELSSAYEYNFKMRKNSKDCQKQFKKHSNNVKSRTSSETVHNWRMRQRKKFGISS